jgi:hypothetical protein
MAMTPVRLEFVGGTGHHTLTGEDDHPGLVNYFVGPEPSTWKPAIHTFRRVRYAQVYPGIDVICYGQGGLLEYDFLVQPGADPRQIAVRMAGASSTVLEGSDLLFRTAHGTLRQRAPRIFQHRDGKQIAINGHYRVIDDVVRFEVDEFDPRAVLVIDPVVEFEAVITSVRINDVAVDSAGYLYIAGEADPSFRRTAALGGGSSDAFVLKLTPDGSRVVYATVLGGPGNDRALAVGVDASGSVVVVGSAESGLPLTEPFQTSFGGQNDAFIARLTPAGTGLVFSRYLGGSLDDQAVSIVLDPSGGIHVVGWTQSANFPTQRALQPARRVADGTNTGWIAKLLPSGVTNYATFLEGNAGGVVFSDVASDAEGRSYVVGFTGDPTFPVLRGFQPQSGGAVDAMVLALDPNGTQLAWATFLGGAGDEFSVRVSQQQGQLTVAGTTLSGTFPTTPGALNQGGGTTFVARLSAASGQAAFVARFTTAPPATTPGNSSSEVRAAGVYADSRTAVAGSTRQQFPCQPPPFRCVPFVAGFLKVLSADGTSVVDGPEFWEVESLAAGPDGSLLVGAPTRPAAGSVVSDLGTGSALSGLILPSTSLGQGATTGVSRLSPREAAPRVPRADHTSTFTASAGTGTLSLAIDGPWTVTSDASWLHAPAPPSGIDPTTVQFVVDANPGAPRLARLAVAGLTLDVYQEGFQACALATTPVTLDVSPDGGAGVLSVATTPGCAWRATISDPGAFRPWIRFPTGSIGSGTTVLPFIVDPSGCCAPRTAILSVEGVPVVTVRQPADITSTRLLAEGATGPFFDTRIALFNAGLFTPSTTVTYQRSDGEQFSQSVSLGSFGRVTLEPRTTAGLEHADFSTAVTGGGRYVIDRTMSWDRRGYGAHAETGVAAASTTWYFAEGSTSGPFDLFYLLQNPNPVAVSAHVRFLLPSGQQPIERTYLLEPNSRQTLCIDAIPEVSNTDLSGVVTATHPIVAERAMYMSRPGQSFAAGHDAVGVPVPAGRWFLAEGATGPFFELFVLMANPNEESVDVDVRYLTSTGEVYVKTYRLASNSRTTIWVDQEEIDGAGKVLSNVALSATFTSRTLPVIVERAMWWPQGDWQEAHATAAATATGPRWALAEGEVGGPQGIETYVLLANTSSFPGDVRVTLRFEDGTGIWRVFRVPANSRYTVAVGTEFPAALNRRFGTTVEALPPAPLELIVERAMYWSALNTVWAAGTSALGTRLP